MLVAVSFALAEAAGQFSGGSKLQIFLSIVLFSLQLMLRARCMWNLTVSGTPLRVHTAWQAHADMQPALPEPGSWVLRCARQLFMSYRGLHSWGPRGP